MALQLNDIDFSRNIITVSVSLLQKKEELNISPLKTKAGIRQTGINSKLMNELSMATQTIYDC